MTRANEKAEPLSLPPHDFAVAQTFLQMLDYNAAKSCFVTLDDVVLPDGRKRKDPELTHTIWGSIFEVREKLAELNRRGAGIFVTINEIADGKPRRIENLKRIRGTYADLDNGMPDAFPLAPTWIVETSPGRFQAHWFLEQWMATELSRDDHASIEARLVHDYGGDKNATDLVRLMRVPGFYHCKSTPHLVRVVGRCTQGYLREELLKAFPPLPGASRESAAEAKPRKKVNRRAIEAALEHIPLEKREDRDTWRAVGCALKLEFGESGRDLWDAWSDADGKVEKFDADDQERVWQSFKRTGAPGEKVVGAGTIIHIARENGWTGAELDFEEIDPELLKPAADGERKSAEPGTSTWPDPDWSLLDDRRGDLPEFPLDVLTPAWRAWVQRAAHGAGVTPAHVMVPLFAVASSLIGIGRRVQAVKSWRVPLTCWTAVIGRSGSGKSPGLEVTTRVLSEMMRRQKKKIAQLRSEHATKELLAHIEEKEWQKDVGLAIKEFRTPPPKPDEAMKVEPFVEPRLFVNNATIEKLAMLNAARPQGTLMVNDELSALFENMSRFSNGSDRPFWLEAWNGGAHVVERVTRKVALDYLLIGLTGGFQQDLMASAFSGGNDGFYARFLYTYPTKATLKPLSNEVLDIDPAFYVAMQRLADIPVAAGDMFVPEDRPLTAEALVLFEAFRERIDKKMPELSGRELEAWSKFPIHALRLCGTLCYMDWAWRGGDEPFEIGGEFMTSATKLLLDYFWPHGRAALRQIGLSERHANARQVLQWLRATKKAIVSREDVRRDALSQALNAEQTDELMQYLEKAGWLRKLDAKKPGPGRPNLRWTVNPALPEQSG